MNKLIQTFFAKNLVKISSFLFTCLGLFLRYQRFVGRDWWVDEIYVLRKSLGPLQPFWQRISYGNMTCFPGQYVLTYPFVQFFGENRWGTAIPHVISTLIGFYLLHLICVKYFKTIWGHIITFAIVCFNFNLVYHSFEFRFYAVLPTLALASFYLSEKIVCHYHELSRLKKTLITSFFILTLSYHAYGIFIAALPLTFFFLIQIEKESFKKAFLRILPFLIAVGLIGFPIFLWYASGTPNFGSDRNVFAFIPNPLLNLSGFLRAIFGNLMGFKKFRLLFLGIPLSFLLPHKDRLKQILFALLFIVIPIEIKLAADILKNYWFIQRQFVWVMPLFAILVGWCWDSTIVYAGNTSFKKYLKIFEKK